MGDADTTPVNIVVSTVVEAENVTPLLKEYQAKGRQVNVSWKHPNVNEIPSQSNHLLGALWCPIGSVTSRSAGQDFVRSWSWGFVAHDRSSQPAAVRGGNLYKIRKLAFVIHEG